MSKEKQYSFFQDEYKPQKFFGGVLLCGRRKSLRPLSSRDSVHFVLRSTWAMGPDSFLAKRNYRDIDWYITHFAKKFGVRIYQRAINSNHIHLLLRITNRRLYRAFIKALSGKVASHVMGQQSFKAFAKARLALRTSSQSERCRETPSKSVAGDGSKTTATANKKDRTRKGFWEYRPFSRVVNWGRDFKTCVNYLKQNFLEAFGFVAYKPRKNYYAAWVKHAAPDLNTG